MVGRWAKMFAVNPEEPITALSAIPSPLKSATATGPAYAQPERPRWRRRWNVSGPCRPSRPKIGREEL